MPGISLFKQRSVLGFAIYDFSNSSYILNFNALLFPIFFRETVLKNDPKADYYWGLLLSASLAMALLAGPFVGHLADRVGRRKIFVTSISIVSVGMAWLALAPYANVALYAAAFVFTNAFYVVSLTLYDSYLPLISKREDVGQVSGFAWGIGYLGGVVCLALILGISGGLPSTSREGLVVTWLFYTVFSFIAYFLLPHDTPITEKHALGAAFKTVITKPLLILLAAFWFINEGIDIVIYFTSLYARVTVGLETQTIGMLLLGVQLLAVPATFLIGRRGDHWGIRKTIIYTIFVWAVVVGGLLLSDSLNDLIIVGLVTSLVIGSSQALMRAYFARQVVTPLSGFSFGLYSIVTRGTALFGPAIFGWVSTTSGSQAIAMSVVLGFLAIGGALFAFFQTEDTKPAPRPTAA